MGRLLRLTTSLLGVVFLVLIANSVRVMIGSGSLLANQGNGADRKSFQFAVFLPAADNAFSNGIKAGAQQAADAMHCAVIFHSLAPESLSFEMASYTGVNGVAVFSYDTSSGMARNLEKGSRSRGATTRSSRTIWCRNRC